RPSLYSDRRSLRREDHLVVREIVPTRADQIDSRGGFAGPGIAGEEERGTARGEHRRRMHGGTTQPPEEETGAQREHRIEIGTPRRLPVGYRQVRLPPGQVDIPTRAG